MGIVSKFSLTVVLVFYEIGQLYNVFRKIAFQTKYIDFHLLDLTE